MPRLSLSELALGAVTYIGSPLSLAALGDQLEFGDSQLAQTAATHYEIQTGYIDPFAAHRYAIAALIRVIEEGQSLSGPLEF